MKFIRERICHDLYAGHAVVKTGVCEGKDCCLPREAFLAEVDIPVSLAAAHRASELVC